MSFQQLQQVGYGLSQATINLTPQPIVSQRAPTTNDKAQIGTIWIDVPNNDGYVLTSIVANSASWIGIGGGAGEFTNVIASGFIQAGGNISSTGGGLQVVTNIVSTTGNITATLGNITAAAGDIAANLTVSAGTSITAGTTVVAGTGITATTGNITASNGDVIISTAAKGVTLPSGLRVISGSGAPSLNAPIGSLYLRTDPVGATSRAYIATSAAGAWTNITCAG